jgi:hypothetical protein
MTSAKALAAAILVATAAPAVAMEPNSAHREFAVRQFLHSDRSVQGADVVRGQRIAPQTNKALAAQSQGFAPIDTDGAILRSMR